MHSHIMSADQQRGRTRRSAESALRSLCWPPEGGESGCITPRPLGYQRARIFRTHVLVVRLLIVPKSRLEIAVAMCLTVGYAVASAESVDVAIGSTRLGPRTGSCSQIRRAARLLSRYPLSATHLA